MSDKKELPRWPAELPLPIEYGKARKLICLSPGQLQGNEDIQSLIHDLFWFPDDHYYIFGEASKGMGSKFAQEIEAVGIGIELTQRCFYPRLNPGFKNDFVHLTPHEIKYDWHHETVKGVEHVRFTIALAPWKRKELEFSYSAEVHARHQEASEAVIEAKPGFAGFSVDLVVLLSRIKSWWRRRRA